MKKRKRTRKLNRKRDQRKALLKSLATSLILKEKIKTTEAKAKEVTVFLEKMITRAQKRDVVSRRFLSRFFNKETTKKLVDEIAPRYKERKGGYTRIVKLGPRKTNGARMAIIELLE